MKRKISKILLLTSRILSMLLTITIIYILSYHITREVTCNIQFENRNETFKILAYIPSQDYTNSLSPDNINQIISARIPEVINHTRLKWIAKSNIYFNNEIIDEGAYLCAVDTGFKSIFSLNEIIGSFSELLAPNTVIITQSVAKRISKNKNIIGSLIYLNNDKKRYFEIVGIVGDLPESSYLKPKYFVSFNHNVDKESLEQSLLIDDINSKNLCSNYILFDKRSKYNKIEEKICSLVKEYNKPDFEVRLQNLKDLYFHRSKYPDHTPSETASQKSHKIHILVVIIILLVGITNHLILCLADISRYLTSIGIKQTFGANINRIRLELASGILRELAFVVPIALVAFYFLSDPIGQKFNLNTELSNYYFFVTGLILIVLIFSYIIITTLSVSSIIIRKNPIKYIRGGNISGIKSSLIEFLAMIQIISFLVLTGFMLIINSQIDFAHQIETQIPEENLFVIRSSKGISGPNFKILKEALLNQSNIIHASSCANGIPTYTGAVANYKHFKDNTVSVPLHFMMVNYDFLQTIDLKLLNGEYFSINTSENQNVCIINNKAARQLGIEKPLSAFIFNKKVIGVVQDFNLYPLDKIIPPLIILSNNKLTSNIYVKTRNGVSSQDLYNIVTNFVFDENLEILDFGTYNRMFYTNENSLKLSIRFVALINLIICIIGLIGLSWYIGDSVNFEVAIRKIHGLNILNAYLLISKRVIVRVMYASILSIPIVIMVGRNWLKNFEYKTSIDCWVFLLPFILTIFITICINASSLSQFINRNPINVIRR